MSKPLRSRRSYLLPPFGYFVVAISGPASYLGAMSQSVDGNIGAGFAMIWTAVWGLPWSIGAWMSADVPFGDNQELKFFGCAVVNVALLGWMMWWRWRRDASRSASESSHTAARTASERES